MFKRSKSIVVQICTGKEMEEDRMGMSISGDVAEITKDEKGLIGISIGGGAPLCPCLYVVQVFDNSPTAKDGRIKAGDEIFSVNGIPVKGERKLAVATMIQKAESVVRIGFNVLHADPQQGHTLDIALKKVKHRVVESMNADTADTLGLSRAILCNDLLLKKLNRLENSVTLYKKLIRHLTALLNSYYRVSRSKKEFGDLFCEVAARESSSTVNRAFVTFGEAHRSIDKQMLKLVRSLHPIVRDLNTFVEKAIPDTKLTLKKYLDVKFEYLSFCLKLKEMDDEEMQSASIDEPLYRLETGNYEYRLMLRCRHESREKFIKLRNDVMVKLELLDQKHVQDIAMQLSNFVKAMMDSHRACKEILETTNGLFPVEVDLAQIAHKYNTSGRLSEDEDVAEIADEVRNDNSNGNIQNEEREEKLVDLS
uniref:PRKCA-binding protein n=1 Tax=Parascaris univalens TaxID=6257 RepID=A0A915CGR9_PARUN